MKYRFFLFVSILLLATRPIEAQSDSVAFASASWLKMNVAPGITLSSHYFGEKSLFSSNQNICYLEIDPTIAKLDIVGDTVLRTVSSFAEQYQAEAAVNGSFFDMQSKGIPYNSVEFLMIDGVRKASSILTNGKRGFHQQGAIAIFNGVPYILKSDILPGWENLIIAEDAICTGPLLRIDSKDEVLDSISFNVKRHPRTAAFKVSDTSFILLVVDGRFPEAQGMSLFELQQVARWMGAVDAINLDGGGSTTMFVKTPHPDDNIVNHPSDNRTFDNKGQRPVANALIVNTMR